MTLVSTAVEQPLSIAMREGSQSEHDAAENANFIGELLAGRIAPAGYVAYLRQLHTVYAALEEAVRSHRDDPIVAAVYDPALERLAALEADLDHWAPGATSYATDSPAAARYAERLTTADWGGLLLAHHYTRYLGDLSGGQAIGRILDRTFELDGAGLAFYDFPQISKPKIYKDAYRDRLDALALDHDDQRRVVAEVKATFGLNHALFDELGQRLGEFAR
jgi:heme oxygenase (biliverdin-producing, ferredoxin)